MFVKYVTEIVNKKVKVGQINIQMFAFRVAKDKVPPGYWNKTILRYKALEEFFFLKNLRGQKMAGNCLG